MKYTVTDKKGNTRFIFDSKASKSPEQALSWAKNCADYFAGNVVSHTFAMGDGVLEYESEKNYLLDAKLAEAERRKKRKNS